MNKYESEIKRLKNRIKDYQREITDEVKFRQKLQFRLDQQNKAIKNIKEISEKYLNGEISKGRFHNLMHRVIIFDSNRSDFEIKNCTYCGICMVIHEDTQESQEDLISFQNKNN